MVTIINRECMENTSYGSRLMWVFEDAASENSNSVAGLEQK